MLPTIAAALSVASPRALRPRSRSAMFCRMNLLGRTASIGGRSLPVLILLAQLPSCASLSFKRQTETSGTFTSSGLALTIFAVDFPKAADQIARENASDSNLANLQVTDVQIIPYLGTFDWILDIVSIRYARIRGTWGFSGQESKASGATR